MPEPLRGAFALESEASASLWQLTSNFPGTTLGIFLNPAWTIGPLQTLWLFMLSTFTVRRRVNFSETDLAGIMHFSNFFRWMEETEHAFYRSMGLSVHPLQHGRDGDTEIGWPRVAARCDYHAPLHFEEEADVQLTVTEIRTKAIRYRFHVRKLDGTVAALGELTVVAVQADPETRKMRAVPIPTAFREKITAAEEPTAQH